MKNCAECKQERTNMEPIQYFVHEAAMARLDRVNKRLWILLIVLISLLFVTNAGWVVYESMFEKQYVEQDIDTGDGDAIIAGIGDVHYGEDTSSGENTSEENRG